MLLCLSLEKHKGFVPCSGVTQVKHFREEAGRRKTLAVSLEERLKTAQPAAAEATSRAEKSEAALRKATKALATKAKELTAAQQQVAELDAARKTQLEAQEALEARLSPRQLLRGRVEIRSGEPQCG